jgi:hypothetical protein
VDTIAIFGPKKKCGPADSIGRRCMKILKDTLCHTPNAKEPGILLTVNSCIKVRLDLQADKSPVVVKGPFFP